MGSEEESRQELDVGASVAEACTDLVKLDPALYDLLYENSGPWSVEEKLMAATYYCVTGSSIRAAQHCAAAGSDIPASTIRGWKNQSDWWKPVVKEIRNAKNDELDAKLTSIIMQGTELLEDRLQNGNTKLLKSGQMVRVPLSSSEIARDLIGILYDKRALIRGDATSRVERVSSHDMLSQLADQFKQIATEARRGLSAPPPIIVDGEVIEESAQAEEETDQGVEE